MDTPPGTLLVTGATGLLGQACVVWARRRGWHVRAVGFHHAPLTQDPGVHPMQADLTQRAAVERAMDGVVAVVHTAAMAQPAACEADPAGAWRLNAEVPASLAQCAAQRGARFIHVSTDLVFPGNAGVLEETSPTAPLSHYGHTKVASENAVLGNHAGALVVRPSLLLGPSPRGDRGVDEVLLAQLQRGERPRLFVDEFRTPALAADVAHTLVALLERPAVTGLLHVAGPQHLSRLELGQRVCAHAGLDGALLQPVRLADVPMVPPRAPDTRLSTARLRQIVPSAFLPRPVEVALRDPWRSV